MTVADVKKSSRVLAPDVLEKMTGPESLPDLEWRNRQPTMAYRRLGDTGLMVSEMCAGGDPVNPGNYKYLDLALDLGVNYLDMAPAYGMGACEKGYGLLLKSSSCRERVFLATKISDFIDVRHQLYKDIFNGLPTEKKNAVMKRATELRQQRGVDKPGYFLNYYPGQRQALDLACLSAAMMRDYRHRVEKSPELRAIIFKSIEGSLRRVGTDYFDILMCPHGADSPEEAENSEIYPAFEALKKQGKVRFLGLSSHNDPAGVLRAATNTGWYDLAMVAYNVVNGGYMEEAIRSGAEKGLGIIAMKAAHVVITHHKLHQPLPSWRIQKVEQIVPGEMKPHLKAYLWALQNPHISAVMSNMWNEAHIRENLSVVGKKVELRFA